MALAKPDPRLSLMSELFERVPSRSEKRAFSILEGAIQSYGSQGIEGTTLDSIAKAAKTSRALVLHYFKDKQMIFEMAMRYIRLNYQSYVVDKMRKQTGAKNQLVAYLTAALDWRKSYPKHANVWILYWHQCATLKKSRALNSQMQEVGRARIQAMIEAGVSEGVFHCKEPHRVSLRIQSLINGTLVMQGTQDFPGDGEELSQDLILSALSMVGFNQ